MKIKGIIFDLDGTLLDSIEDITNACNTMLHKHGFPTHPVDQYINWIGNGAGNLVRLSLPGSIAVDGEKFRVYLDEYKNGYMQNLMVKSALYEGVPELLVFLNEYNIPMAVNTNKPHEQSVIIADHFLKPYHFKIIQGQMDDVPRKPDSAGALLIAGHLGLNPSDIVYIGDSTIDVMTSKAAGMKMIGVKWGYGTADEMKRAGCEYLIDSPVGLITFIKHRI